MKKNQSGKRLLRNKAYAEHHKEWLVEGKKS